MKLNVNLEWASSLQTNVAAFAVRPNKTVAVLDRPRLGIGIFGASRSNYFE